MVKVYYWQVMAALSRIMFHDGNVTVQSWFLIDGALMEMWWVRNGLCLSIDHYIKDGSMIETSW